MAEVLTAEEIERLRADTPGCRDELVHLNHAGSSLPSQRVLDAQIGHLRREAMIGGYEAAAEADEALTAVYGTIAASIGAEGRQIARMEHATGAWAAAFWSIPMRPGQRIITHPHDYGGNAVGILHAAATRDLIVEHLPTDPTGQVDLEALGRALERPDDVAVVSLSWIPTNGGLVNPAAGVGALTRAAGVPFLLDACQAVGQLSIDVDAIGCDFLAATGRKYLRAPRGTGFLYASDRILEVVTPAQPDHHGARWTALDAYEFQPGARRFEQWECSYANWLGLGAAVSVATEIGPARIQATVSDHARRLRAMLADIGMTVHDEGLARCGIVTASHPDVDAPTICDRLRDRGVNTSFTVADSTLADMERRDLPSMVRLSVHCINTVDELDRAVEELRRIVSPAHR